MSDQIGPGEFRQMGTAARARRAIDTALSELADPDDSAMTAVPPTVARALIVAKEALSAERTECRKETPYSEMVLIGSSKGLYYICSHEPAHEYPLKVDSNVVGA